MQKPPPRQLKINWDATYDKDKRKLDFEEIIRNAKGLVMGTLRATRNYNNCPFIPEANSLLLALVQFCKDIGIQQFTLEGDALRVVNGMQKHDADWSQGGSLIQDAKLY